jgi:hypothetical protein
VFASLLSKPLTILVLVATSLIALAVVSRNWSCREQKPPRPPHSDTYEVVEVTTGASIIVATGLGGRKRATVALAFIQAPQTGPEAEASTASLAALVGGTCRVEWARTGLLRGTDDDPLTGLPQQEPEEDPIQATAETTGQEPLEARPPAVGVVFGESGQNLSIAQLEAGMATCLPGAPKDYIAAEQAAKRRK